MADYFIRNCFVKIVKKMAINHIKFIIQTFDTKISLSIMIVRFFKYISWKYNVALLLLI